MPTAEEVLLGFAKAILGLDESGVKSSLYKDDGTLKDDATQVLLDRDQKRIAALKEDSKKEVQKIAEDRYNAGKRESMSNFEQALRDKFGLKSTDKRALELVDELVNVVKGSAGQLTADDVKKHPAYIELEKNHKAAVEGFETKLKSETQKIEGQFAKEKRFSQVKQKAWEIVTPLNPILPKDPAIAARQRSLMENELGEYGFDEVKSSDGTIQFIPLDKDGKRVEDAHGNAKTFEALVKEVAQRNYEFAVTDPKSSAGNPNEKGTPTGAKPGDSFGFTAPKSRDEYARKLAELDSEPDVKLRSQKKTAYVELAKGAGLTT